LQERANIARRPSGFSWRTHGALLVVQAAFAAGAVEGKLAMRAPALGGGGVAPLALAMARMVGATLFFQVLTRVGTRGGAIARSLPAREHLRIAGLSVLGIVLNQTLYLVGLRITTAFAAALLAATIPVFTAGLAVLFRVEKASVRTGLGLALALAGVLWLTGVGRVDVGAIVIALNCLSYSLYIVFSKRVVERVGALTLVTWLFTWGAVMLAPLGMVQLVRGAATYDARAWGLVAFVVVVPTIVAYLANAWALGRSSPTLVTAYIYLQPVLAALLQWVQLGEPVEARALVAAGFILVGVGIVASRR
jgi:drug/metabolite transporter (DMT)-like permease